MWSKKPTPVAIARGAGAVEVERDARRRSRRSCGPGRALRLMLSRFLTRAAIDSACTAKPSASAIGAPAARERRGRAADVDLAIRRRKCADGEARGEARRAAGRQRVVRARDVVAERGRRSRRRRTGSPARRDARRERLRRLARPARGARARAPRRRRAPPRGRRRRRAPSGRARRSAARGRAPGARARPRRAARRRRRPRRRASRRRARPARAGRARPAAGRRPRSASTSRSRRAGEAVDPDAAGDLALGLLHVEVARADDHVDGPDRLGAEASAAIAWAPPMR